jgi:hypothetical protein
MIGHETDEVWLFEMVVVSLFETDVVWLLVMVVIGIRLSWFGC